MTDENKTPPKDFEAKVHFALPDDAGEQMGRAYLQSLMHQVKRLADGVEKMLDIMQRNELEREMDRLGIDRSILHVPEPEPKIVPPKILEVEPSVKGWFMWQVPMFGEDDD